MKQAHRTDSLPKAPRASPDAAEHPDSPQREAALYTAFLNWLAYFSVYLGVVAVVSAIGLYSFWKLPVLDEWSQLFKGGATSNKALIAANPPDQSTKAPPSVVQPLANPPETETADALEKTAVTPEPNSTTATESDPNAPPQVVETPSAEAVSGETTSVTPAAPPQAATPPATPPTPVPQTALEEALTQAQEQMSSRRFTAPANANALQSYQRVLEIDPRNAIAQAGIEQIAAHYQEIAAKSLREGRPDESLAYVSRGLRAAPASQELLKLRSQAQLLQRQREQQAQQEEAQRRRAEQAQVERVEGAEREAQEEQLQARQQPQQRRPAASAQQPWWQQAPTYNNDSGFNQR